jgi:hypothetical protein
MSFDESMREYRENLSVWLDQAFTGVDESKTRSLMIHIGDVLQHVGDLHEHKKYQEAASILDLVFEQAPLPAKCAMLTMYQLRLCEMLMEEDK